MHIIFATLASAGWLFISGAVVFAGLLPRWFQQHFGEITRPPKELPLWAVAVEKALQGLGLALLVSWTSVPVANVGVIALLLVTATYLFSTYANYRVKWTPVLVIAAIDALRIIVAIVLVGVILGHQLI